MDNDKFDQWFNSSPFCFYEIYNAHKSPLYCITQKFKVKCFSLKEQFLTIDINFKDIAHQAPTDLLTWSYYTPKSIDLLKFKKNNVQIDLPLSFFFLKMGEFNKAVCLYLVEKLEVDDLYKFVQLNNDRKCIQNDKGKDISDDTHIYELKEYDELKPDSLYTLHFLFKP